MPAIWLLLLANWTQGEFTLFRPVRFFMMDCGNQVPFLRGFSSSAGHGGKGLITILSPCLTNSCCVPIPAKWPGDVELFCIYSTLKPLKLTDNRDDSTGSVEHVMKLYPWTLLMVGVPKHHFGNKEQSLRGTLHSLGFVRVMSAFCWDSHHQFLGDCFL